MGVAKLPQPRCDTGPSVSSKLLLHFEPDITNALCFLDTDGACCVWLVWAATASPYCRELLGSMQCARHTVHRATACAHARD